MTGYQEVITDPSYRGQIVAMTYPQIGNYGINPEDAESREPHIRAFVIGELCEVPSNWRSTQTLADYLESHSILGIEGIDTRALTKHLRSLGAMRACVSTELTREQAIAAAQASPSMEGMDYVREVSTPTSFHWGDESRDWVLPNVSTGQPGPYTELPPVRHRIVAYDFGIKFNILRRLRQAGFEVEVISSTTTAAEVLAKNPTAFSSPTAPAIPPPSTTSTRNSANSSAKNRSSASASETNCSATPSAAPPSSSSSATAAATSRSRTSAPAASRSPPRTTASPSIPTPPARGRSHPHQPQRRHRRRHAPPTNSRSSACNTTPKPPQAPTTPPTSSRSSRGSLTKQKEFNREWTRMDAN
jgi:hypothetical protein